MQYICANYSLVNILVLVQEMVLSSPEFLNVAGMAGSARAIFLNACAKSWVKCAKKGELWYVCTKFELWVNNMSLNAPLCLLTAINSRFLGFYCTNLVVKTLRKICQHKCACAKNLTFRNSALTFGWFSCAGLFDKSRGDLQHPWQEWRWNAGGGGVCGRMHEGWRAACHAE